MKKQGFTLQELLISLAIVGVVAAMTVPAIMGIMPDETKVKYMKAYNALTSITNDLISDNTIYWTEWYNDDGTPGCIGLLCDSGNDGSDYKQFKMANPEVISIAEKALPGFDEGEDEFDRWHAYSNIKYPASLASRMNLQLDMTYDVNDKKAEFTTTDGTKWTIQRIGNVGDFRNGYYTVQVDVNPDNNQSIEITDADVDTNKVDTFTFDVSATGSVRATDRLGQTFLKTPTDMHRKKEDRKDAITVPAEEAD